MSTVAAGSSLAEQFPDRILDGPGQRDYITMSGTSMSAAVVSGAVALLLESKPTLTPQLVKLALQGSAQYLAEAWARRGRGRPSWTSRTSANSMRTPFSQTPRNNSAAGWGLARTASSGG